MKNAALLILGLACFAGCITTDTKEEHVWASAAKTVQKKKFLQTGPISLPATGQADAIAFSNLVSRLQTDTGTLINGVALADNWRIQVLPVVVNGTTLQMSTFLIRADLPSPEQGTIIWDVLGPELSSWQVSPDNQNQGKYDIIGAPPIGSATGNGLNLWVTAFVLDSSNNIRLLFQGVINANCAPLVVRGDAHETDFKGVYSVRFITSGLKYPTGLPGTRTISVVVDSQIPQGGSITLTGNGTSHVYASLQPQGTAPNVQYDITLKDALNETDNQVLWTPETQIEITPQIPKQIKLISATLTVQ